MKKQVILSARLQAVADMVTVGNRVCDVGCDHGYVPVYLIQNKISPAVLAMDVREGPLLRAKEHTEEYGLKDRICLRLSDGLTAYRQGEADTLICAGMGGKLMQKILLREPDKSCSFKELILQPQSELADFRRFLEEQGYFIIGEDMILEEDKFYPIMKVIRDGRRMQLSETEARFGPLLLEKKHPVLCEYIRREWKNCQSIRSDLKKAKNGERMQKRLGELEQDMEYLKQTVGLLGMEV